jgi:formylglycine-generating enzyme required for sulfatase activity
MVQHSLGCIDAHEVTSADYAAFTAKVFDPALASRLPIGCIFKNAEHAYTAGHPELGSRPATDIDWCDAYAYCLSLDKHLCGLPGGGAVALAEAAVTTKSEWYAACSKEGSRVVPYTDAVSGTSQEAGLCVLNAGQTLPVDRSPNACEGGYPGLFDMVGNVEEWIDSCEGQNETSDCIAMGSAYDDDLSLADSSCGSIFRVGRNSTKATVGFRCCR